MSLTLGARRAEAFADLLDRPTRTDDPALAPFLALAGALSAVPAPVGPTPEFRAALRQRLLAVATVQGVGEQDRSAATRLREAGITWNFQRRMAVLAGSAAAATAIAGVGVGASRSLPGDPFYGVKRATERVQLATAVGQEAKGKRHLEFARTRLAEVEALVGQNSALAAFMPGTDGATGPLTEAARTSTIISTLQDMDSETRAGANDLLAVAQDTGSTEPLAALNTFTRSQYTDLRSVLPELPAEAQPRAQQSLALLAVVADRTVSQAKASTGSGTGSGGTSTPTSSPAHPAKTATPTGSGSASSTSGSGTGTSGTQSPAPTLPSTSTVLPTEAPTIPALPSTNPLPSTSPLPTDLPSLPDLSSLLGQ